ncbi:hypothetical protein NQ117_10940 [Paenibacillus sp. SC116]|uniref:hypothetical protein n=1 Tax=Paenibacillus sp. SC116 TaxID=2968986 RepID=UPI00215B37EC|nr:hypothetical protein [Paenibacillus sp. SC116]MCR8844201.1 hypothetical protein [Paenibacillus sp. SC116]
MKEAFIIDLQGKYIEPTLVMESVAGVFDIVETVTSVDGQAQQPKSNQPNTKVTGYTVAIPMPEGLYEPQFDVAGYRAAIKLDPTTNGSEFWKNGLTQAEIEALKPKLQPNPIETLGQQLVARELEVMELRNQNASQGAALVALELRLLNLEGVGTNV